MKLCTKCKTEKLASDFYKRSVSRDGLSYMCKSCFKEFESKKNIENRKKTQQSYRENNPVKFMYWAAKKRAKESGMEFNIDESDIIIPANCPYLGTALTVNQGTGRHNSRASLDRIDSSKGYVKGNIEVISDLANRMKNNATKEELIQFATGILKRYKS